MHSHPIAARIDSILLPISRLSSLYTALPIVDAYIYMPSVLQVACTESKILTNLSASSGVYTIALVQIQVQVHDLDIAARIDSILLPLSTSALVYTPCPSIDAYKTMRHHFKQ